MTERLIKLLLCLVAVSLFTAWLLVFAQDVNDGVVGGATGQEGIVQPSVVQSDLAIDNIEYLGQDDIEYLDQYVGEEVVKEVPGGKPIDWREFVSLKELMTWLAGDDTDEYIYLFAGEDGVYRPSGKYDCDDYALQLQRRAAESGFLMSVTIIEREGKPHMINLCVIGNNIYYIEPQTDQVWFYSNRD